jgi:hypothetical protein
MSNMSQEGGSWKMRKLHGRNGKPRRQPGHTIRRNMRPPGRNAKCPCGSGKKYKKCCGKQEVASPVAPYSNMTALYSDRQTKASRQFVRKWGFEPNPSQLMVFMMGDEDEMKDMVVKALNKLGENQDEDNSKFIYAVRKLGCLITPLNEPMLSEQEKEAWSSVMAEYDDEEEEYEPEND